MRIGTVLEPVVVDNANASDAMPYDLVPWTGGPLQLNVWAADDPKRHTRFRVVGTPDATAYESITGHALVADIKTRGPAPYKQWAEQGAEISHPEAVVQLAAYQAMLEGQGTGDVNAPVLLICLDTGAREWDWERIPGDRARAALLAETERLMPLVDTLSKWRYFELGPLGNNDPDALETVRGELTPARDFHAWTPQCKSCPFAQACRPEQAEVDAAGKEDEALMAAATLEPIDLEVTVQLAHEATDLYVEARGSGKGIGDNQKTAGLVLRQYLEERGVTGAVLGGHRVSLGTAKTYSVDRKLLAELVDPDIRRQVLKERETHAAHRVGQAGAIVSLFVNRQIWRYQIVFGPPCQVSIPTGGVIRHAAIKPGENTISLWVEVDTHAPRVSRTFQWIGTGHEIPLGAEYVGTGQEPPLVWHLYELSLQS